MSALKKLGTEIAISIMMESVFVVHQRGANDEF